MTANWADRFSEAYEGTLTADEKKSFDDALSRDPGLAERYARFQAIVAITSREPTEHVDLVNAVQRRIRERSGGRFYRDRFSAYARPQWIMWSAVLLTIAIALGLALYVVNY